MRDVEDVPDGRLLDVGGALREEFLVAVGGRCRPFDCVNGFGGQDGCGGVKCLVGHSP